MICYISHNFYVDIAGCSAENDDIYGIAWPSTRINMNATNSCPGGVGMHIWIKLIF